MDAASFPGGSIGAMTNTPAVPAIDLAVWEARSNAARKAIRTTLQVIIALVPNILLLAAGVVDPAQALGLSAALTPLVTFAQNLLEDKGVLGTWLRRPTPEGTVSAIVTLPADPAAVYDEDVATVTAYDQATDDVLEIIPAAEATGQRYTVIRRKV